MHLPGFELRGHGEVLQEETGSSLSGLFELKGDLAPLAQIARPRIPEPFYPISGDLRLEISLGGSLDRPEVTAQLEMPRLEAGEISAREGVVRASWRSEVVRLDTMGVRLLGGRIGAQADLRPDTLLTHSLRLSLEDVERELRRRHSQKQTGSKKG